MSGRRISWVLWTLLVAALTAPGALAQDGGDEATEYRLGTGDVLSLNVLASPELDGELTVQPDSTVFIPLVGELAIGGLTVAEAEQIMRVALKAAVAGATVPQRQ